MRHGHLSNHGRLAGAKSRPQPIQPVHALSGPVRPTTLDGVNQEDCKATDCDRKREMGALLLPPP